jgi:hypothetical protein
MRQRIPASSCPRCGYVLDGCCHIGAREAVPKPGDVTVCLMCNSPMMFGDGLVLESTTMHALRKLLSWEAYDEFVRVRVAIEEVRRRRK